MEPENERHGLKIKDEQGVAVDIDIEELYVNPAYQRTLNRSRVNAFARAWSWIACGTLTVGERQGKYYVIDGQHRLEAAKSKGDIKEMPCLVFEVESVLDEAKAFLVTNVHRRPIPQFDRYRALVTTKDETALLVKKLCDDVGREVKNDDSGTALRPFQSMYSLAQRFPKELTKAWPIIHEVSKDRGVHKTILEALMYIELHLKDGQSISDPKWRVRVLDTPWERMMEYAQKSAALYIKGGSKAWAIGVLEAINSGHKKRLEMNI